MNMLKEEKRCSFSHHPLSSSLVFEVRMAYIQGVICAVLLFDHNLSQEKKNDVYGLGFSMNLSQKDIDDLLLEMEGLSENERQQALRDIAQILQNRDSSMFFLCDIAKILSSSFLQNVMSYFPLEPNDTDFLSKYLLLLLLGRESDASETLWQFQTERRFIAPKGLVLHFSPNLNPIQLQGGDLPIGESHICDGKFFLNAPMRVTEKSKLILKNADLELGANGFLQIDGGAVEIENCLFATRECKDPAPSNPYMIQSQISQLVVKNCKFDGGATRSAIHQDGRLRIFRCTFDNLFSDNSYSIYCEEGICKETNFSGCSGDVLYIKSSGRVKECRFTDCQSNYENIVASGGENNDIDVVFVRCHAKEYIYFNDSATDLNKQRISFLDCSGIISKKPKCTFEEYQESIQNINNSTVQGEK